ncbi:RodZ domain-containing protein [Deinococcus yavapaiensis]|uniref:Cytoskeleton protein RodZ n=1 Tax=Deinococcus yavapaiensis KR-236 TaxID=694435 RepID=A0A318SFE4_9DEIO|nr:RodZ domain-containing protein [Deinococcus yavapaiensis]PYE55955.1 cytoskeleton protein RodZ [Deinococcus yavapaiensis KR-236]
MRDATPRNELKAAREARGWTLADVSKRTSIRAEFLRALEEGDFSSLPERPYARSYLLRYAAELGVEATSLLANFDRAVPAASTVTPRRRGVVVPVGLVAASVSVVVVLATLGWWAYAAWRSHEVTGSKTVTSPQVTQAARGDVRVTIDSDPSGARVYLDNRFLGTTPVRSFPLQARASGELRVERDAYKPVVRPVTLQSGRWWRVTLKPTASPDASTIVDMHLRSKLAAQSVNMNSSGRFVPSFTPGVVSPTDPVPSADAEGMARLEAAAKPEEAVEPTETEGGVTLSFVGESWVRVTDANGRVLFEGVPAVGSSRAFPKGVHVRVGSAGAVTVAGVPLGTIGQVLERAFP